ncbi:MAG: acetylornithine/succinylornithine family transaminase, partial [Bdellovibrionota bacterium]
TALGHAHPAVTRAIQKQAAQVIHTSNLFLIEPQVRLAEELVRRSFADRAFFCNSGAEAVEAMIKLARRWGAQKGGGRFEIIVGSGGFHGRTLGALSATPQEKYQKDFGPLLPGFITCPRGDLEAFRRAVGEKTCAILVEPIQGESGVHPLSREFVHGLRALCNEKGILLLFDEIQVGMGRTGSFFAYEHYGVEPDALTLAKALGNGMPVGALLARKELAELLGQGSHGSTFGGNFLASAAALATVKEIAKKTTLQNVVRQGAALRNGLEELARKFPARVKEIRGAGLLVGIELHEAVEGVQKAARERGLIVGVAGPNTIRFAPSLLVTKKEVGTALSILESALEATQP